MKEEKQLFTYKELLKDRNLLLSFILEEYYKNDQLKLLEDANSVADIDNNRINVKKLLSLLKKGEVVELSKCIVNRKAEIQSQESRAVPSDGKLHVFSSQTAMKKLKSSIVRKGVFENLLLATNFLDSINTPSQLKYFQIITQFLLRNPNKNIKSNLQLGDFKKIEEINDNIDINDEKVNLESEQIKRTLLRCISKRSLSKNTGLFYRFYLLLQNRPSDFPSWPNFLEWQDRQIKIFCGCVAALIEKEDFVEEFDPKFFPKKFIINDSEMENTQIVSRICSLFNDHLLLSLNSDALNFDEKIAKSLRKIHEEFIEKMQTQLAQVETINRLSSSPLSAVLTDLCYPPSISIQFYDQFISILFQVSRYLVKNNLTEQNDENFTDVNLENDDVEEENTQSNLYRINSNFESLRQLLSEFLRISPNVHSLAMKKYKFYYQREDKKIDHQTFFKLLSEIQAITPSIPSEVEYQKEIILMFYEEIKRNILNSLPNYQNNDGEYSESQFTKKLLENLCELNDNFQFQSDFDSLIQNIITKSVSKFYHQFYANGNHANIDFNNRDSLHHVTISTLEFIHFLNSLSDHLPKFFKEYIHIFEEYLKPSKEIAIAELLKLVKFNLDYVLKGISSLNLEVCKLQHLLSRFFEIIQSLSSLPNSAEMSIDDLNNNVLEPFFSPLVQNWIQEQEIKRAEYLNSAFQTENWQPMDERNLHCVSISDLFQMIKQCFPILFALKLKSLQEFFFITIARTFTRTLQIFTSKSTKNCPHMEKLKMLKKNEKIAQTPAALSAISSLSSNLFKNFSNAVVDPPVANVPKIPQLNERVNAFFASQILDVLAVRLNSLEYSRKGTIEIKETFELFIDNEIKNSLIEQNNSTSAYESMKENINLLLDQAIADIESSIDLFINYISTLVVYYHLRTPFILDLYASKITESQVDQVLKILFPKIIILCNLIYSNLNAKLLQSMLISMIEGYEWVLLYSPNRFFLPDNHLFFIEDIKKIENFFLSKDENYPLPLPLELEVIQEWTFGIKMMIMDLFHLPTTSLTRRCEESIKNLNQIESRKGSLPIDTKEIRGIIDKLICVLHHRNDQSAKKFLTLYYSDKIK